MKVTEILDRIDWNFPGAGTDFLRCTLRIGFLETSFPKFLQPLSKPCRNPGDLVFDPFGGSGTTAVEAVRLGRKAILSDRVIACV